jgi:5'-AMP-activated protein kinase catalytic alpha subunit
MLCGYLPF